MLDLALVWPFLCSFVFYLGGHYEFVALLCEYSTRILKIHNRTDLQEDFIFDSRLTIAPCNISIQETDGRENGEDGCREDNSSESMKFINFVGAFAADGFWNPVKRQRSGWERDRREEGAGSGSMRIRWECRLMKRFQVEWS